MKPTVRWTTTVVIALVAAAIVGGLLVRGASHEPANGSSRSTVGAADESTPAAGDVALTGVAPTALAALRVASPGATITTASMRVGRLVRSYLIIAPSAAHGPVPLLVVLGGSAATVVAEAGRDQLVPLAQTGQAIVVYPSPYTADLTWNAVSYSCCQDAGAQDVPDADFVTALVPVIKGAQAVSRVDLVGFSNGGKLAFTLSCREPALFDAIAVVSAVPLDQCSGAAVPIFVGIGSLDPREPREDARSSLSATVQLQNAVAYWRHRDGCADAATASTSGVATVTTWARCSDSTQVTQVLWAGVDHIWPRTNDVGASAAASTLVWAFFTTVQ